MTLCSRLRQLLASAVLVPLLWMGLPSARIARAQAAPDLHAIADAWQGTLHIAQANKDLRVVVKIEKAADGMLKTTFYAIDQGGNSLTASKTTFVDGTLHIELPMIDGSYEGKMAGDGKSINGTWKQGDNSLPLLLERATQATAWTIPEPPKKLPQMDPKLDPGFEVATIKPSAPDKPGKAFLVRGGKVSTFNTTVSDLIAFAYGVHTKQITGGPAWLESSKFDIDGKPDQPGTPSTKQLQSMFRKLLAERFQLKFHEDQRELSAYVITVGKNGQKMTKSEGDANSLPALFFTKLGRLTVTNADLQDFAELMQSAVLDRPVVDHTGLEGRWNFLLTWTPDDSQFASMGVKVPPPSDAADAPPPLFTAIQEQIGLKLDAAKTQVKVLAIDKLEKPSDN
ncbi:TIGR03435 family protein [Telmatobacter bradus]|uniref:TIGR03435 family protein n=1 Tax=Telmatobacter bradus TaxID=474953 RepID=UPI003B42C942